MEYAWYVLATAPIHALEFEVMLRLTQMERAAMVPFEQKSIKRKGRRYNEKVKFPLYPRYVFVQLPTYNLMAEHHIVKTIDGVQGLISPSRREFAPYRLPDEAVSYVKHLSEEGSDRTTETNLHKAFQVGASVTIVKGPFAGFPAKVESIDRKRINVMLMMFGSMRVIPTDAHQLAVA